MALGELIAEAVGTGDFTAAASTGGANISNIIMGIVWFLLLAVGVWFAIYWTSFKHTVLIREVTATRKFIVKDKARIRMNKDDNVEYWYLRTRKISLVSPDPESVEITKKGRFFAEVYHDLKSGKDGGYSWVTDNGKGNFISYPAEHRALLSARIRRAQERRGKSTFEMVMTIAAVGIPLVAMVLVFSFWGDLTKSTIDAQNGLQTAMKDFSQKVSNYTCQQSLSAQGNNNPFNPSIPMDVQSSGVGG
jgi:hypothetical protein